MAQVVEDFEKSRACPSKGDSRGSTVDSDALSRNSEAGVLEIFLPAFLTNGRALALAKRSATLPRFGQINSMG